MNKYLPLFFLTLIIYSCNNQQAHKTSDKTNTQDTIATLQVTAIGDLHDSLWAVYRNPKATPVARLHALRDLFDNGAIQQRPDTLAKYVNAMDVLAEQVGDRTLIACAVMNRGVQYMLLADLDSADSCYVRADSINGPNGDQLLRAQILANQGQSLSERGLTTASKDKKEEALALAEALGNEPLIRTLQNNLAGQYAQIGDVAKAVELFTTLLQGAEKEQDSARIGNLLSNIGACHNMMNELVEARPYFSRAAAVFERLQHPNLPRPYLNLASTYLSDPAGLDSALYYCNKALVAAEGVGDISLLTAAYTMKSEVLMMAGRPVDAVASLHKAIEVAQDVKNLFIETMLKGTLSRMMFDQGNTAQAIMLGEEMMDDALQLGNLEAQKNAAIGLMGYYRNAGRYDKALEMFELKVALQDSSEREENQREMIRQEYKYNYDKKALADSLNFAAESAIQLKEVQKQKLMRNSFMGGFLLVALFAGVFFFQRNRIRKEKKHGEELLHNILPEEVAEELKAKGSVAAVHINQVTVLFTDFKDFTTLSEKLDPQDLVHDLNECFSAFDHITEKHSIEKIKTIGDSYMAAGGLPMPNKTHASDVIKAALEMRDFIAQYKAGKVSAGLPFFEVRIGIHTGPVVAGIVGVKKFSYDIWGDTVNTASRMENSGEAGKVNISGTTYELVKDKFACTQRGKLQAKGKGELDMYFVEGRI